MSLSDTTCKNAKPKEKPYKLADEKAMFLLVNTNGSKYFRLKYRFGGKEKTLALGVYPETTLKQAREKREAARQQIADGIDPGENKKAVKQSRADSMANSFEVIANEWYERNMSDKSEHHKKRAMSLFQRDIFPYLGIVHFVTSRITNGILEGINSKIQLAKRRARGYRNINNFINMIYFLCGKLKFDYPLYFT